jgi:ribonuclease HI
MTKKTIIYTDGSSRGNPGPGGWGAIIADGEIVKELGGVEKRTTNNRMELIAVVKALEYAIRRKLQSAEIRTDSSYVLKGATLWLPNWKRRNWKTAGSSEEKQMEVANRALWEKMDFLLPQIKLQWTLLEGHIGIDGNERCDEIATVYADGDLVPLYEGYQKDYPVDLTLRYDKKLLEKKAQHKTTVGKSGKAYSYLSWVDGVIKIHKNWAECEERVKGKSNVKFRKALSAEQEAGIKKEFQALK